MEQQKNKGGRPSNAELAARGMTKTELEAGLRLLRKHFGPAVAKAIELASSADELPLDKQFRMQLELIKLFMEMKRADQALKNTANGGESADDDDEDKPIAPVFQLLGKPAK
jgi:hypothetical protein